MDTIFALSTPRGRGGVAVIRVSGPHAYIACKVIAGSVPKPRIATVKDLRSTNGTFLDRSLVLYFEAGASFTGEDVVEFQVHGGTAVIDAVLNELSSINGCRLADHGEFTRRALINDRIDLIEAEGIGDVISAETAEQLAMANELATGGFGDKVQQWRSMAVRALALCEATIDFADEEVPEDVWPEVDDLLNDLKKDLSAFLGGFEGAARIREGFEVAIIGKPNVGKSSLLNLLAGREAAITSSIAGTTRDVIEVRMDILGFVVTLLDTAGIRDADDEIEAAGVRLAMDRAKQADIRILLLDETGAAPAGYDRDDCQIVVKSKSDVSRSSSAMNVSGVTGEGLDELMNAIGKELKSLTLGASGSGRLRHKLAVEECLSYLDKVELTGSVEAELVAEDIRGGIRKLESLIGNVDVEDLLGEIFSSFCIGK